MTAQRSMAVVLLALMLAAAASRWIAGAGPSASPLNHMVWSGFLFGIPLILATFAFIGSRWVLMAGVIYGTIGLALDISTIVQETARSNPEQTVLWMCVGIGLLNVLVIAIGGRGFLDVPSPARPQASPPPNLPPRSSA